MADCGCNNGAMGAAPGDAELVARAAVAKTEIARCAPEKLNAVVNSAYELPSPEEAVLYLEEQAQLACAGQPLTPRWKPQPKTDGEIPWAYIIGAAVAGGVLTLLLRKS